MVGYVYLTTNLINGRKYIGRHNSRKFDKHYFGSGKILKQALEKYGEENFKIQILYEADTLEELWKKEAELIEQYDAVNSPEFYNLTQGGPGGGFKINGRTIRYAKNSKRASCNISLHHIGVTSSWSSELRRLKSETMTGERNHFYGKTFTPEKLERLTKLRRGKKWINDGVHSKNVCEYQLDMYLEKGWRIGRIMKTQLSPPNGYYVDERDIGRYLINNGEQEILLTERERQTELEQYVNKNWRAGPCEKLKLKHIQKFA